MSYDTFVDQNINTESELAAKKIVNQILRSGKISPQDHKLLTSAVMTDTEISEVNRRQVNLVFDYIQTGRIKLIGW